MGKKQGSVGPDVQSAQRDQKKRATGKDAELVELEAEELEERIAPGAGGTVGSPFTK